MEKFKIIYADPPWSFINNMKSGAKAHYNTMELKDICNLPINKLADEDCVLFMWWVASQPKAAIEVVESWGFTLKTMSGFNWVKTTKNNKLFFGMGFWTRAGSELCLIATKGKPKRINASIRSVELIDVEETIFAKNEKHSKKPDVFRNRIVELMGDLPRIELFARKQTDGWAVFGDEVENTIYFED